MAGNETEAEDFDFKEYEFSPKTIEVNGVQVEDWTGAELDKIFLANKKDILEKPRPSWIPEFDGEGLEADGWLPACAKDYATGDYYVQSRTKVGERDRIRHGAVAGKEAVWETKILKMPLDLLSATIDYYLKRKRAELKRDGSERTVSLPRALNRMTLSRYDAIAGLMGLCECYKNEPKQIFAGDKEAKANGYDRRLNSFVFYAQWTPLLQAVKDKRLDMNLQKRDATSMFEKGEETGYGKSGRTDALFEKFGVMAKKQSGSKFRSDELLRAENALSKVWAHYGNLTELAKKADLTFSFAADTFQHARKASGLYRRVPDTDEKAIGVSFFQGKRLSGRALPDLILAHEAAHWLDSEKGKAFRCHFASDKDGTLEREIALKFKKLFRERNGKKVAIGGSGKKVPGEYWSRTCECLARAMEEHYGLKMGLDCYEEDFAYLPKDIFLKEIAPLCERLMEENKEQLLLSAPAVSAAEEEIPFGGVDKSDSVGKELREWADRINAAAKAGEVKVGNEAYKVDKSQAEWSVTHELLSALKLREAYDAIDANYEAKAREWLSKALGHTVRHYMTDILPNVVKDGNLAKEVSYRREQLKRWKETYGSPETVSEAASLLVRKKREEAESFVKENRLFASKDEREIDSFLYMAKNPDFNYDADLHVSYKTQAEAECLKEAEKALADPEYMKEVLKASADGIEKSEKELDMENEKAASEEAQNSLFENETGKEGNAGKQEESECLDLGALYDSLESDNGNAETAYGLLLRRNAESDGQLYYDLFGSRFEGRLLCCDGEECFVKERGDGWVRLISEANVGDPDLEGVDATFKLSEEEFNIATKKISLSSPEKSLEEGFGEEATTQELDSAVERLGYYFEYNAGMRLVDIYESESGDLAGSYGDGGFGFADGAEIPSDVFGDVVSLAERYFRASAEVETNGPEQAAEAAEKEFKKVLDVSTASVPRESDLAEALRKEGYADGGNLANEILNKYNRLPQGDENKGLFLDESGALFVRDYLKDENHVVALSALAEEAMADIAERAAARIPAFEIVRNEEKGRVNIKFPADRKHPRFEEITKALKSHGWKFAPSTKMWYPLKVEGSEGFAKALLAEFSELKGPNVRENVTEKVTENAGESDKGAYKDLISELREEYDKIYNMDSAEQAKILRERNARFNELSKNEEFNQLVAEIANERGDFISSDREVAALMVVMDKNGMLDKFSGKIESKIKAAPSPTDDKKQEEYKLNAFAEKTGINLNNHLVLENRKIVLERGSFALGGLTKKEFEDLKSKLDKANVSYKEEVRGETKVCLVDLSVLEDSETEKKDIIEEEKSRLNGTLKVYTRLSVEGREVSFDPDFNTSFAARPYDEDGRRKFVILEEKRGEHATHITSVVADLPYIDDWKKATLETLKMLAISEEGLKNGFEHRFYSYEYVPELLSRIEFVDSKTGEDVKKDLLPEEVLEASDPEKAFLKEQEKKVNGFELLGLPYVKADWSESGEVKGGTVWGFEEADKALAELNERLGQKGGYYKTELKVLYPTEGEDEYGSYAFRFDLGSVESFGTLCDYIRETCSYPKEVFPGLEKAWKSVFAHSVEDNYVKSVDTIVKRTIDRMKPAFEEAKKALSEALKAESKVMSSFLVEASAADAAESGVSAAKKKCAKEFEKILAQLAASTDPILLGCDVKSLGYESCKAWSDFSSKNALTDLLCEEARLSPPADEFDWPAWRKMMDAIPSVSDFGKLLSAARQESRDAAFAATLGPKAENFSEALSAFAKRRPNLSPLEAGKILMKAVRPEELPKVSDWLKGQGCVSEEATAKKFAEWISGKEMEKKAEIKEPKKQPASFDRELF